MNLKVVASVAALMLVGATSCVKANPAAETFAFGKSGIASVKIGADYTSVPASEAGLYTRAECRVCCGGEDGEGVDIAYYDGSSDSPVITATLDVDQPSLDAIYEVGLECNDYPLTDARLADLLRKTGSTKISYIMVAPSPRITVNVGGQEMATSEPARKFMELPGAVTTASMSEGIYVSCTIGDLTMSIMNAYEALTEEAMSRIGDQLAAAMETGVFEPVEVKPTDVNPGCRFDSFSY